MKNELNLLKARSEEAEVWKTKCEELEKVAYSYHVALANESKTKETLMAELLKNMCIKDVSTESRLLKQ